MNHGYKERRSKSLQRDEVENQETMREGLVASREAYRASTRSTSDEQQKYIRLQAENQGRLEMRTQAALASWQRASSAAQSSFRDILAVSEEDARPGEAAKYAEAVWIDTFEGNVHCSSSKHEP